MWNVVIWGAGKDCRMVIDAVRKDKCKLTGIADLDEKRHKTQYMNQWKIDDPRKLINERTDFVIISTQRFSSQIKEQCRTFGMCDNQIVDYWNSDDEYDFIDGSVKKIYELEKKINQCKRHLNNISYELGLRPAPIIRSAEELLKLIIKERKSLSRFGDGELDLMQNKASYWFQTADHALSERLKSVFESDDERIIIALGDYFGSLERYTEEGADGIRKYLENGTRDKVMGMVDMKRVYYDAYVTRPYAIYKDKEYATHIFALFKRLWMNRDVLLIEGSQSYIGIGNDLFEGVGRIRRIIAPSKNAFSVYDKILKSVEKYVLADTLVLISLGMTATVLAYDLAMKGIQAVDFGQLDQEYEWYLRGDIISAIPGKSGRYNYDDEELAGNREYIEQIVDKVLF